MTQLDLFSAEIVTLRPSPRAPFVLRTAMEIQGMPQGSVQKMWRAAVAHLTGPLLAAGVPEAQVRAYALAFRDAVQTALDGMVDGPDGPPGTRQVDIAA